MIEAEVQNPRLTLVHQMPATNPESTNLRILNFFLHFFLRVTELKNNDLAFRTSAIKYKETKKISNQLG